MVAGWVKDMAFAGNDHWTLVLVLHVATTLLMVGLISPDGRFDDAYLSNYATTQVKDVLSRVGGVGKVEIFLPLFEGRAQRAGDVLQVITHGRVKGNGQADFLQTLA